MSAVSVILIDLFIIFAAAKGAALLARSVRQPPVIGELLAGILIGPHVLGLIGRPGGELVELFHGVDSAQHALDLVFEVLAELGVIILLFFVGLETQLRDVLKVGMRAVSVGILGIVLPFAGGFALMAALGHPGIEAAFVGTAMVATSIGISARVMRDLGVLGTTEARIILGAAVVDDVLAVIMVGVVAGFEEGAVSIVTVLILAAQAFGFVALVGFTGTRLSRRYSLHLDRIPIPHAPFVAAMFLMLGLAALAGVLGLAAIIGAFLAGMVLAEAREHHALEEQTTPVYEFIVPFFFVITGARVDPSVFGNTSVLALAGLVTTIAVVGKLIGCGLAGYGMGLRSMSSIGVGMVPRGEVGLIVAGLGVAHGILGNDTFSAIVVMVVVTTVAAPPVLALLYGPRRPDASRERVAPEPDPLYEA